MESSPQWLYWTHGLQEADDSPRNVLMHSAVSATSYQGLAAHCLTKMAAVRGREDMKVFFIGQAEELKQLVNRFFELSIDICTVNEPRMRRIR